MPTQTQPVVRGNASLGDRYAEIIARYFGPTLTELFRDDDVTEIYVNPQECVVRVDTRSRGKVTTAERMSAYRVEMLLNAVAASIGENLTPENPRLQAELPKTVFRGSRLQGFVSPVSAGPSFTIRKPPTVIYSLDDYIAHSVITAAQRDQVRSAIAEHRSIVVAGGVATGSWKVRTRTTRADRSRAPSRKRRAVPARAQGTNARPPRPRSSASRPCSRRA